LFVPFSFGFCLFLFTLVQPLSRSSSEKTAPPEVVDYLTQNELRMVGGGMHESTNSTHTSHVVCLYKLFLFLLLLLLVHLVYFYFSAGLKEVVFNAS
jgi:hypothetical protein